MADPKVKKLTIKAFKDAAFSKAKAAPNEIVLQVNPQEIAFEYGIEYGEAGNGGGAKSAGLNSESAAGESALPPIFKGYTQPGLSIETLIDATGVLPDPYETDSKHSLKIKDKEKPTVEGYISLLKKVCYSYVNETHGPPYLTLQWGSVMPSGSSSEDTKDGVFKCQLESLGVKYTLFSSDGRPIRAELSLKFKAMEDPEIRAKGASPDLTHYIDVKYGDNLPTLCTEVYGSPEFFLQVARINNLSSIYAIKPGMRLLFPPLDKASR